MSGFQFVIDFVEALAWPAAIVVIVIFLRRPIVDILMQLASGLRRLRSGPSDAEFDRVIGQAKAELTAAVSAGAPAPSAIPVLLRFAQATEDDPASAVTQAFSTVEASLRGLLGSTGKLVPVGSGDPTALARFARDQALVPESVVRAVDAVVRLRNSAAADPPRVTRDQAAAFLALVDALLYTVNTRRERAIAGPPPLP